MATLVSALDTEFTPAAGDFIVQASGVANLLRKNSAGASFVLVGTIQDRAVIVSNPVGGAVFKFSATSGTPAVQADQ